MKNSFTKADIASFILRIALAGVYSYHGIIKIQSGWSELTGLMQFTSVVEILGAIGLLVWCTARWAAFGLSLVMVGAIYHHFFVWNQGYGKAELAIISLAALVSIVIVGAGRHGLSCRVCKNCKTGAVDNNN